MRIRDYIYENETAAGTEPAAAGTGEQPAGTETPSAGTENADKGTQGPPESIPYSRFKEVNDALRPYKELEGVGYNAAELQRLVEWEQHYSANPEEAWLNLASTLDLPQEVKDAIVAAQGGEVSPTDTPAKAQAGSDDEGEEDDDSKEPPEWAKPLIEDYMNRRTTEAQEASNRVLDGILASWDKLDADEGITIPDDKKESYQAYRLSLIAGNARGAKDPTEILQRARGNALAARDVTLSTAIRRPGESGPQSVPAGTGAGLPQEPPTVPQTIDQAKVLAEQWFERGGPPEES